MKKRLYEFLEMTLGACITAALFAMLVCFILCPFALTYTGIHFVMKWW